MGNIWFPKAFLVLISMKVYKWILKMLFASEKYFLKWLLIQCGSQSLLPLTLNLLKRNILTCWLRFFSFQFFLVWGLCAALNAAIKAKISRVSEGLYGCTECAYSTGYLTTMQGCPTLLYSLPHMSHSSFETSFFKIMLHIRCYLCLIRRIWVEGESTWKDQNFWDDDRL